MKQIIMDFDENDNPVITVKGVKGKACKDLTRSLELALGTTIDSVETDEYKQREVTHEQDRARNFNR